MSKINANTIYWVASWGYDQTQYSIYEEVSRKGSFVVVRGWNSWACLGSKDLWEGSKVKIYQGFPYFNDTTREQREQMCEEFNWDRASIDSFDVYMDSARHEIRKREENAEVRTIVKVRHFDHNGYKAWEWELDNGEIVKQTDNYIVWIVDALTRRRITNRCGRDSIKIDDCIRAYIDPNFAKNSEHYAEQNEYTAYNGH